MKKVLALLLAFVLVLSLAGCAKTPAGVEQPDGGEEASGNYKIGIVTGTTSQGEEEFRAGERLAKEYPDMIKHITYPDKFAQEVETTVSQVASLAADPDLKAIVFVQAVTGAAASIDKVRETRDDILFILGAPHEDPDVVAARADIALDLDQLQRGVTIMERAKDMGAETFVHYSFPRHMQMELLSLRRDKLKETAEALGIEFVEVDSPDPLAEGGVSATQQFILEDVPRQVAQYGKNTAFFGTNCGMMEPLIKQVLDEGAIFPEQCCPSPYHAYPNALGIKIPADKAGDIEYLVEQIKEKVAEKDGTGRFATWNRPANVSMVEAGVKYAQAYIEGDIDKLDKDAMLQLMEQVTGDTSGAIQFTEYDPDINNFLLFVLGSEIF